MPARDYDVSIPAASGAAARGRSIQFPGPGMTTSLMGFPSLRTDQLVSSRGDVIAPLRSPVEEALEVVLEVMQAGLEHRRVLLGLRHDERALQDGDEVLRQGLRAPAGAGRVRRLRLLQVATHVGALPVEAGGAHV